MFRRIFAIVVTLAVVQANVWAQTSGSPPAWSVAPRSGAIADGWRHDPLPQFGVPPREGRRAPLPQIGLPLPPIGLQSPAERPHRSRRHWPGRVTSWPYVIFVPWSAAPMPEITAVPPAAPAAAAKGSLVLDVEPATAQVFVDGFYTGIVDDFGGRRGGAFLDAGPHSVEVFEPGYEPVRFDVRILPNESVVYRRALAELDAKPPASAQPAVKTPTTIYMIPGCYVGNVPPKDAGLPATCDLTQARTYVM